MTILLIFLPKVFSQDLPLEPIAPSGPDNPSQVSLTS